MNTEREGRRVGIKNGISDALLLESHGSLQTLRHMPSPPSLPMEHLQHNPLMDSKLGYDVSQEQVSMVLGSRVHTLLREEAGPSEGHEAPEFGTLPLVVGVMDVRGRVFHQ